MDWNNPGNLALDAGSVAPARVVGAVRSHGADIFILQDLVEPIQKDQAVTVAAERQRGQMQEVRRDAGHPAPQVDGPDVDR